MSLFRAARAGARGLFFLSAALGFSQSPAYRYFRAGNRVDAPGRFQAGFALMGGGKDLDSAFTWLCRRAGGGDLIVLRATGGDDYNAYIRSQCHLNSVATMVIPSRVAAHDGFVTARIREASAVFIAGGDQAKYINFWMGTPVESALNDAIDRGVPLGGTSAGLAVLGEYVYSAQADKPDDPDLDSGTALGDPYGPRVTLVHKFLDVPILAGIITDSHFARRNRMGRLIAFLARIGQSLPPGAARIRGIGVEERGALLLEPDGDGTEVGSGSAYFVTLESAAELAPGRPTAIDRIQVQKVSPGHSFQLGNWSGDAGVYTLHVRAGTVGADASRGAIY